MIIFFTPHSNGGYSVITWSNLFEIIAPMDITQLRINEERFRADFEALAQIGETANGGVTRLALSNEDLAARAWLADTLEQAGLLVRDDDAGNLSGVLPTTKANAKTLLVGSHLDSVPDGGRFDGSIGVLGALECARTIKEAGLQLPFDLEIIDFTDEEGCWQSLFGSKGLTGKLTPLTLADINGQDYGAFRAALYRTGIHPGDIHKAKRSPKGIAGYLELHIEQGPRLYEMGVQIGVVTGIVGRTTYTISFFGEPGHSGTTTSDRRHDALLGASVYITEGHRYIREVEPQGIFNCGKLEVFPGAFNVIPERAVLTMECRHPDEATLTRMEGDLIQLAQDCAEQHKLRVEHRRIIHMPAVQMAEKVMQAIETGCNRVSVGGCTRLVSYAGHDAQMMSDFTPSGMIFVPSVNGISHNPKEYTEWPDVITGVNVMLHAILALAKIK